MAHHPEQDSHRERCIQILNDDASAIPKKWSYFAKEESRLRHMMDHVAAYYCIDGVWFEGRVHCVSANVYPSLIDIVGQHQIVRAQVEARESCAAAELDDLVIRPDIVIHPCVTLAEESLKIPKAFVEKTFARANNVAFVVHAVFVVRRKEGAAKEKRTFAGLTHVRDVHLAFPSRTQSSP